jgi:S1-C subfamily serine protease
LNLEDVMSPTEVGAGTLAALSDDLADAVARASRSVVAIHARRRIPSSGVVWRDGIVLAANHTISREEDISLTLPDGGTARATLAGRDPSTDIAVLRTESNLVPAQHAGDDQLRVGRMVLALGRPGTEVTASLGIISAVGGEWRTWHGERIDRFVRLDLSVYDGFSGGALVDTGGRVLGLNTSGLSRAAALTIPPSTVNRVVDGLLQRGRIVRGYLGIAVQPVRLPQAMQQQLGLKGRLGLVIINLDGDGPAERAGLLLGDIITGLNDRDVSDPSDILASLAGEDVGKRISLRIVRAGTLTTVPVTIGERPSQKERTA